MDDRELARQFEAFRARGDAGALERVFDRTAPELLRVASHLAPDLAEAEDLVQATFVTAIERASSFDARRDLVAWLIGILAHHARNAGRRRARQAPAAELERPPVEDPARALERRELGGVLRNAIEALPERDREVLGAHLLEGRPAVEIARTSGRAPGTVRMQIARGLERLRRALPATAVGAAALVEPGTRGLAAVRAAVMEVGTSAAAGIAGAAGATTTAAGASSWLGTAAGIGGLAMGTKAVVGGAGLVLALALGWWLQSSDAQDGEQTALAPPVDEARADAELDLPADAAAEVELGRQAAGPEAEIYTLLPPDPALDPDAPGWWLVGEITGIGAALERRVAVNVLGRDGDLRMVTGNAAGDGPYAVELTPLFDDRGVVRRELRVSFAHTELEARYLPLSIDAEALRREPGPRKEIRADVELARCAGFRGRVELADGSPAQGARLALFPIADDDSVREPVSLSGSDAHGSFTLKTASRGRFHLTAFLEGTQPTSLEVTTLDAGYAQVGVLRLGAGTAEIRGRVVLPPPLGQQRARVVCWREGVDMGPGSMSHVESTDGRFVAPVRSTWSEPGGAFVLSGLEAGVGYSVQLDQVTPRSIVVRPSSQRVVAPSEDVVLGAGLGALTVRVESDGQPLGHAEVRIASEDGRRGHTTDEQGQLVVLLDPARGYELEASAEGHSAAQVSSPAAERGPAAELVLELRSRAAELATLALEPALVPGYGLPDPQVFLHRASDEREPYPSPIPFESRDGAFWFEGLEPGTWEVRLEPSPFDLGLGAACCVLPATLEVELGPGALVRERVPLVLGGAVSVRAEGALGKELRARAELLDDRGQAVTVRYVTRLGRGAETVVRTRRGVIALDAPNALHPALPPGTYELRASLEGHRCEPLHFTVAGGSVQELTLRFWPE